MPILRATEDLETHNQPDPLVQDCINYDQINSWIRDCEQHHDAPCNKIEYPAESGVLVDNLVDVFELKVVPAPADARYFALSYTWGGVAQLQLNSNLVFQLSQPGSLKEYFNEIPLVIRDAMEFVASCKERYLWVDSLCIVQDDKQGKYAQIERMGAIYNNAVLTLVAGTADDANAPLAGVRPGTRVPEEMRPKYYNVYLIEPGVEDRISFRKPVGSDPYQYLGRRPRERQLDILERLSGTEYNNRAWTYQERLLSRRCLYFMENMVYFHCRQCIRGENKYAPYTHNTEQIRPLSLFKSDSIFSGDPLRFQSTLFAIYAHVVKEYSSKQLSYDKDVINAFSGIAAAMQSICSWRFMYGLPIDLLDLALLWTPHAHADGLRRISDENLPSWSWTGWTGPADYDNCVRIITGIEPFFTDTISAVPFWTLYTPSGVQQLKSSVRMSIFVGKDHKRHHAFTANVGAALPRADMARDRPVLVFDAYTMPFDPRKFNRQLEHQAELRGYQSQGKCVIEFGWQWTGYRSDQRSYLYSTENMGLLSESSHYDLVILSFSKRPEEELEDWNYLFMRWNFMLVRWHGDFAERVAVGYTTNSIIASHISSLEQERDELLIGKNLLANWKRIALI